MTNRFVTTAVMIECDLLTSASADLADYTIFGFSFRPTAKWTKNEIVGSRGGHVAQCPIDGDATDGAYIFKW